MQIRLFPIVSSRRLCSSSGCVQRKSLLSTLEWLIRFNSIVTFVLTILFACSSGHNGGSTVKALSQVAGTHTNKQNNDQNHNRNLNLFASNMLIMSESFITAGELTSDMASKLPNWYSSKEGLTGESPAVFGGCGMALIQAGTSIFPTIVPTITTKPLDNNVDEENESSNSFVRKHFAALSSDLASAACALDPIGIATHLDEACEALDFILSNNKDRSSNEDYSKISIVDDDDDDSKSGGDGFVVSSSSSSYSSSSSNYYQLSFERALYNCGEDFKGYGALLCYDDPKGNSDSSAGRILAKAGSELQQAGIAFSSIPWSILQEYVQRPT